MLLAVVFSGAEDMLVVLLRILRRKLLSFSRLFLFLFCFVLRGNMIA